jgi:hypothetical protein
MVSETGDSLSNQRKPLVKKMNILKEVPGSHTSYWPIMLAVALVIVLVSIMMTNAIVFGIGVVLVAAAAIGWGLEKR